MRLLLFPVIVIPLGIVTFVVAQQAWQAQRRLLAARGWAQTPGRVIQSGVGETQVRVRRRTSAARFRWATRYVPEVVYEYQVQGRLYRSDRLQLGYSVASSEADAAQRHADRYPINSEVTVYYQPDDPAEATLSINAGRGLWALWGMALVMLLMTLVIAAMFWSILS